MSPARLPDFLIIGAQKAATTTLLAALREHPDAWLPADEDHYFHDPVFDRTTRDEFLRPYASRTERRVGLKCPNYLGSPEVPKRVAEMCPNAAIVACLRNPVDRAVSAYFWHMRWGLLPLVEPNVGLTRLLDGSYDSFPLSGRVLDWGRYAHHLNHWLGYFGSKDLLVLLQEDLRRDRSHQLETLFAFLDLDAAAYEPRYTSDSNSGVYPLARLRFLRIRNRLVVRWDETGTHVTLPQPRRSLPRLTSGAVAAFDRFALSRIVGNQRPPLSADVQQRLTDWYADDITQLEHLLQRDLSNWRVA